MIARGKKTRVGAYAWIQFEGKTLMVKQAIGPNAGKWSLPGGGIEFGEAPIPALIRELKEECSLEISHQDLLLLDSLGALTTWGNVDGTIVDCHWVGILYEVKIDEVQKNQIHYHGDNESAEETRWFSVDDFKIEPLSSLLKNWILMQISNRAI